MINKAIKKLVSKNFLCFASRQKQYKIINYNKYIISRNVSNIRNDLFDDIPDEEIDKDKLIYLVKNIQMIDLKEKGILNNISNLLKSHINQFNIDEIYLIIHSFSKLNFTKYSLYNNFVKIIMTKKPVINTRILTQILIDFHKTSSLDLNALTFFTQYYINNLVKSFSLFDLSMILYIFNKYNYNDFITVNKICQTISEHFIPIIDEDKGVLTTILLSLSVLNLNYEIYSSFLKLHVYTNYERFEIKYLCNISYSIVLWLARGSVKDKFLCELLKSIVFLLINNMHKLKNDELKQLHIVLYFLRATEENYKDAIKKLEKKNIKNTITVSKMQQQVEKIFTEIGLNVDKEFPVGPYMLDFALKKKKIYIEVNGFTHYYTFDGKINNKTNLKYFILNKLKWKIITIEYMDWKNKSKDDKIKYIETNILEKIK
ncbi:RAP protein, putative [Plasmodium berghei]|uniref:RAP protein, putative n=2 Tax=Plasmodium berghei TaxID=5821 RepID=A0A509AG55_PLABA|nr:RAP protein, putative [Plasmodium berghei ANKA]CXI09027.1 RAP protein, putative [Plasmodium berghei]SCL92808.1 RAP protein, putative [Plasmodium berghei]SCM15723.1 RAP protein, putative [Plasmodium berghei]SCM17518.1 RAP protein, putative [Plasmodium berghei]SCN22922.1 RAP protein, putative [Plasmodium berghei]|eukprot:XP_034420329.1 RAP protein, putative [Plasmodium berghei ANKA]